MFLPETLLELHPFHIYSRRQHEPAACKVSDTLYLEINFKFLQNNKMSSATN